MFDQFDATALGKSILVHVVVIGLFFVSWNSADEVMTPKALPMHVTAMVVEKPRPPQPTPPKPEPKKPEPKKPEPKKPEPKKPEPKKPEPKKPEPKKPEPKKPEPKKPDPRKQPEPKKPEPKKPEPKKPEPKTESVDFSDILQSEMKQLDQKPKQPSPAPVPTATSTSDKEQDEIQQYLGVIQQTISRYWIRPPSARTGMVVTLRINLLPGGELNDVNVIESSGNAAFDRSAILAVQKAGRFSVPSDPAKFDRYFRSLRLRFNPEDLRY